MSMDSIDASRLPPQNPEAERSLLGCLLRNNELISEVVQNLRTEHFYAVAHQLIYKGITHLYVDKAQPVDLITLANHLNEMNAIAPDTKFKDRKDKQEQVTQYEEVGGAKYLAELWDAAPVVGNATSYANIVRQKAIVRFLVRTCHDIEREAFDQSRPAQELLDHAEKRIMEIAEKGLTGETKSLQDALQEAYTRLDARKARGHQDVSGIPTGYLDLDNLTAGFQNNELIIVAARPSVGKTAFALNILRHICVEEKLPALFVSLEQARIEIAERLLCCQARINSHNLRRGMLNSEETDKLYHAGHLLSEAKMYIDDTPGQSMLRIAANARRLKLRHGIRICVIDYLQLIDPDDKRDSRQEQVSAISRRLKFLARELEIPVIALAQVNRSSEDRQDRRPRLSDLRESGAIEQDADTVMLLHRADSPEPGVYADTDKIEIIVGKQRNGPTGEIGLVYVKKYMRFENLVLEHSSAYGGNL